MPRNWRLLETELVDICRSEGFELDEDQFGDKIIVNVQGFDLSLTYIAQELTRRGVLAKGHSLDTARTETDNGALRMHPLSPNGQR